MLIFTSICPHPPIIIPNINGAKLSKVKNTIQAMKKLAEDFVLAGPETTIIISPHGPIQFNKMTINKAEKISGDFTQFNDYQTPKIVFENDLELMEEIKNNCEQNNIPLDMPRIPQLDHGTLVPLYYLTQKHKTKIVPIAFSYLDLQTHFKFGKILGQIIKKLNEKVAVVASGDLSHRITSDAPAGFSPRGKEFDKKLIELLQKNDVHGILNLDSDLIEEAGECGLRSVIILLGVLSNFDYNFQLLSYETPFGVGYLVAKFEIYKISQ